MGDCCSKTSASQPARTKTEQQQQPAAPILIEASADAKSDEQQHQQQAAPILTEASDEEKVLTQLKGIFERLDTSKDGHVSKTELVAALDQNASLGALIKEAGLNQEYNSLLKLETSTDGRVTLEQFQKTLKKQAVAEVLETDNVVAVELPAGEKALQQLKKIFECLSNDADEAVSRVEFAARLKKDESLGRLVSEAGFNPEYYVLEQLNSNEDGQIKWQDFEEHLRKAAKEGKEQLVVAAAVVLEQGQQELELQEEKEVTGAIAPKGLFCCG